MEKLIVLLATLVGLIFLGGLITMWLWNWIMPDLFNLPEVSYWQAWGIMFLSTTLFKSGSINK